MVWATKKEGLTKSLERTAAPLRSSRAAGFGHALWLSGVPDVTTAGRRSLSSGVRPDMLDSEFQRLKTAFRDRQKPSRWVRENMHPVDSEDATDFVRDIESGHDRADLFESAIPYFALLTDEARLFLLPD